MGVPFDVPESAAAGSVGMPRQSILAAIARAYFARERQRLGITAEERATRESDTGDLVKRAQLAHLAQQMGFAPAEQELHTRLTEAQIRNLDEPNRLPPVPKVASPFHVTDEHGNVTVVTPQSDGTYTQTLLHHIGKAAPPHSGKGGAGGGGLAANPFTMTDETGRQRSVARIKGGGLQFVDEISGVKVGPGPTAEMRNTEYQGAAMEPAFTLVRASLDNFEQASKGGLPGAPSAMVPGTDAYYARSRFVDQAKALLGAIVARQAGEGSRLSDEDRRSYSQAAALVNGSLLLPGGIEEARTRIDQAETLLANVQQRRKLSGGGMLQPDGGGAAPPHPADVDGLLDSIFGKRR